MQLLSLIFVLSLMQNGRQITRCRSGWQQRERDIIANEQRQLSFHIALTTSAYRLLHISAKSSGSTVVS